MASAGQLWTLHREAKAYGCRPSELLGVSDAFMAYCLDNAVFSFGDALEIELESQSGKTSEEVKRKKERVLRDWLGLPKKYRNPTMGTVRNKPVEEHTVKGED